MDQTVQAQPKIAIVAGGYYATTDLRDYDLSCMNLAGCNFEHCDMRGLNLTACDLKGCSFVGANLTGVTLKDANLYGLIISGTIGLVGGITRSDGHVFYAVKGHPELMIKAGCRWFGLERARSHWAYDHQTTVILDCLVELAKCNRGG